MPPETPDQVDVASLRSLVGQLLQRLDASLAQNDAALAQNTALTAEVAALNVRIAALLARVAELEAKLGQPPRTPSNSSLPPSKGFKANRSAAAVVAAPGAKPPRPIRAGVARELAADPDRIVDLHADRCSCGHPATPADQPFVHAYDLIDIPPIRPVVTRVHLHRGACRACGRRIVATPPADLRPGSPFGAGIRALLVYWHTRHMVGFERLRQMAKEVLGLDISEGAIVNVLARAAPLLETEAERAAAIVRAARVVASDETSARVKGRTWWQWVMSSTTAVRHIIADTRGQSVVTGFLAGARPEVWVSDRYAAQAGHAEARQVCLAHLLRDAQYAFEAGDWRFALPFKQLLGDAILIAPFRDSLDDDTLAACRADIERELGGLLDRRVDCEAGRKLRDGIARCRDQLFVFVTNRDVPPTNNVSEQHLRPSVIHRKVTNGFRSEWGARVYADITSVTGTARLRGITALDAIRTVLAGRSILDTS